MIEADTSLKVTGEAGNGQEAVNLCRQQQFDLALLDIRMPVMNGLEASKLIREIYPDMKILILTTFNDEDYAMEALKNQVNGYLLKNGEIDELHQAIYHCLDGGLIIEGKVAAKVMPSLIHSNTSLDAVNHELTERELSILSLIGQGHNNQEIAEELFLSIGTVKNNISGILDKLDLRDRTQLAIYAIRHNLDRKE
ncbi:two component transcriptional regulator, LuxR family [Alkalibacterium pelagium]|uniref:Two component transcriptional regulator, LuxR family n=2 Tax=Alkalibacterium pelagium TaxID=426702 RepID=A0A1H7HKB4_9LACT|nr:two component transcriptional regulator, LuxR family [Alkalibacterium pelagium]